MPNLAQLSAIRGLWATTIGVALVVIACIVAGAWFVPLLVVGGVLIGAGVFGPRFRGRFSLEFGEGGVTFDVQVHLAPPGQVGRLPRRGAAAPAAAAAVAPAAEAAVEPPAVAVVDAADMVRAAVAANGNGNGNGAAVLTPH